MAPESAERGPIYWALPLQPVDYRYHARSCLQRDTAQANVCNNDPMAESFGFELVK